MRSRKAGDTLPAVLEQDKTKYSPADAVAAPQRPTLTVPAPPKNTPRNSAGRVPTVLKPWPIRQGSIRPHYNTRSNTRQHSYRVPDLEDIESSESGDSHAPSLSRSNSATSDSDDDAYKHATRLRESVDDRFSGYLLALAARAAEKQLRDQEAAAFANSDFHQPVAHYVDDDASEEEIVPSPQAEMPVSSGRQDSMDEMLALKEMQKHGERLSKEKQNKAPDEDSYNAQPTRKKTGAVFNVEFDGHVDQTAWMTSTAPKNMIGGYQRDPDLKQMRKAASPPMLGGDLEFPRCPSPEHARFDVTQGSDFLKASMCYLTEQGMWGGAVDKKNNKSGGTAGSKQSQSSCWSGSSSSPSKSKGGLWGGFCTPSDAKLIPQPSSGLVTPMRTPQVEKEDPFSMLSSSTGGTSIAGKRPVGPPGGAVLPPSPPSSNSGAVEAAETVAPPLGAECEAAFQAKLDKEFNNAFVSQVFNYLSLGYPALARKFDDELSRISRVPIETLRLDDKMPDGGARGYLHLPDEGMEPGALAEEHGQQDAEEKDCQRWLALRTYIREWTKQIVIARRAEGDGKEKDPHSAWGLPAGLPARKGSWGL